MVAHKVACHTLSKAFFEINEDMVHILQMLEVLFTQDSKVEDLFCVLLPALNPACSSAWGFCPLKMTYNMTLLE